ncbi:hypothetical protein C1N70_03375 [Cytobacillus firmus]
MLWLNEHPGKGLQRRNSFFIEYAGDKEVISLLFHNFFFGPKCGGNKKVLRIELLSDISAYR